MKKKLVLSILLIMCAALVLSGCNIPGMIQDVILSAGNDSEDVQPPVQEIIAQPPIREPRPDADDADPEPELEPEPVVLTPAQIFDENADAVFTIYTSSDDIHYESIGSGFFVSSSGIAVTNHHVMVGWPYAFIRTHSGLEFDIIGYYSYDASNDLAVIQVDGDEFPYLTIGDSENLRIGDSVFAIGSPLGYHNTFSTGIISRFDEVGEFGIYRVYGMIQITVPISGGSSGGALLNETGEVVGITTAGYSGAFAQQLNFAVPSARINLDGTDGSHSSLPIGEAIYIPAEAIIGSWVWDGGTYVFEANGTGDRVWDGYPESFDWRTSGPMLVLSFDDGYEERWAVYVINHYEITIGGAFFMRATVPTDAIETLVGTWNWHAGWYAFAPDGSGSRMWSGAADSFRWTVTGVTLVLSFDNGDEERWEVQLISDNDVIIGGAPFARTG